MKKFKEVYSFNVADEVRSGVDVCILDKLHNVVHRVSELYYEEVLRIIDDNTGRYYFYKIEEVEEEQGNGNI